MPLTSDILPSVFRDCKFQINASLCAKAIPSLIAFMNARASLMEYMHNEDGTITDGFAADLAAVECAGSGTGSETCPTLTLSMTATPGNTTASLSITSATGKLNESYQYIIKRDTVQIYPVTPGLKENVTGTSITFNDTGLTNGTEYDYECVVSKDGCSNETCSDSCTPTAVSDCEYTATLTLVEGGAIDILTYTHPLLHGTNMTILVSAHIIPMTAGRYGTGLMYSRDETWETQFTGISGITHTMPVTIGQLSDGTAGLIRVHAQGPLVADALIRCGIGVISEAFLTFYSSCLPIHATSIYNAGHLTVDFDVTSNCFPEEVILEAAEFTAPSTVGSWFTIDTFNQSTTTKPHKVSNIFAVTGTDKRWGRDPVTGRYQWIYTPIYETSKTASYAIRHDNFPADAYETRGDGSRWLRKSYAIRARCRNNISLPAGNSALSVLDSGGGSYRVATPATGPLA